MARLVLIETSGNQRFIFATNKLRQNIGASELIHRIGTSFVLTAVAKKVEAYKELADRLEDANRIIGETNGRPEYAGEPVPAAEYVRELDRIAGKNPVGPGVSVEVLVATSGKAVLLVDTVEIGEAIIEHVTLRALREAPGAVVRGIVERNEEDEEDKRLEIDPATTDASHAHQRMTCIHRAINELRLHLPAPEARFPMLPFVAPCATSGLPAEHSVKFQAQRAEGGQEEEAESAPETTLMSEPAFRKHKASDGGWRRITAGLGPEADLSKGIDRLEKMGLDWLAVVHADGNGFGEVFLELNERMPEDFGSDRNIAGTARAYCDFYRKLSLSLELAGLEAFRQALLDVKKRELIVKERTLEFQPIVPIVLGGDDLTVICDGGRAVTFAECYLREFEQATEDKYIDGFPSVIPDLVGCMAENSQVETTMKFGAAAGIVITKQHHPFHRAYHLAEELIRSAKTTKRHFGNAISSLDFQVVYQDAARDLASLRADWTRQGAGQVSSHLYARPYVVTEAGRIAGRAKGDADWAEVRHLDKLKTAMRELRGTGGDDGLPRSQQHALRTALFEGPAIARSRLAAIRHRYRVGWNAFGGKSDDLFSEPEIIQGVDKRIRWTRFLDALELIDIGEGAASPEGTASKEWTAS